jgi:hypothetical protein
VIDTWVLQSAGELRMREALGVTCEDVELALG